MIHLGESTRTTAKRLMGVILAASPFGNFLYSVYLSHPNVWWKSEVLVEYVSSLATVSWLLWGAALGAGVMLLIRGSSNLVFAIALLGINIFYSAMTFRRSMDLLGPLQTISQLSLNLTFLGLMIWFEFLDNKEPDPLLAASRQKFAITLHRSVHIKLTEGGEWAQILQVKNTGIVVRMLEGILPAEIAENPVELLLPENLTLRLQGKKMSDVLCEFTYLSITPEEILKLRAWAHKKPQIKRQQSLAS